MIFVKKIDHFWMLNPKNFGRDHPMTHISIERPDPYFSLFVDSRAIFGRFSPRALGSKRTGAPAARKKKDTTHVVVYEGF